MSDFLHPTEPGFAGKPSLSKKQSAKSTKGRSASGGKDDGGSASGQKNKAFIPGVNLMSEEALRRSFVDQQKKIASAVAWSFALACLATVIAFVGVKAYGLVVLQHERELAVGLGQADVAIAEFEKNATELNLFTNKLETLKGLFENHLYYTQFIAALERYTLPTVSYSGLSIAPGSAISFSATAPDFQTLARQLRIFQNEAQELMSSVIITSGSAQLNQEGAVSGVSFEVSFSMNPNILKKSVGGATTFGGK